MRETLKWGYLYAALDQRKVKEYLDGVLAGEEYTFTYRECREEVYRVFNYRKEVFPLGHRGLAPRSSSVRRVHYGAYRGAGEGVRARVA